MPGAEVVDVAEWLFARLTALGGPVEAIVGDRVFPDVAPDDAAHPLVVYQVQSAADVLTASGVRVMVDGLFLVRGIMPATSYSPLRDLAEAVDAELALVTGGTIESVRTAPYALTEDDRGQQFRHLGGFYRVWSQ